MIRSRKLPAVMALALVIILLLSACSGPLAQIEELAATVGESAAVETVTDAAANIVAKGNQGDNNLSSSQLAPDLAAAQAGDLVEIYEQVNPSVVHIQVVVEAGANNLAEIPDHFGIPGLPAPDGNTPQYGEGSGFVWDKEGHIITNNHVIDGASKITVVFADDTIVEAELVGADRDSDLAVLKVDLPADELLPVVLGDSTSLQVGELAIAIGNPFGQEGTMTVGIISALGRLLPVENSALSGSSYNIPDVIQTDAAINPGNSGGVLLDGQGEVIGVTSAIISAVRSSSGIGFAVPSSIVEQVVPVLISEGSYEHPYLGISGTSLTPDLAEAMDLPAGQRGALVIEAVPDGPADEAGIQGSDQEVEIDGLPASIGGDVIVAIDGQSIDNMDDLITFLSRNTQAGQEIEVTILRDGQEQTIQVALGTRPRTEAPAPEQVAATESRAWLGIRGLPVTPEIAAEMDLSAEQTGVLVERVEPDSPAENAGLRGGDTPVTVNGEQFMVGGDIIMAVDEQPVTGMQDLIALLAAFAPGDEVSLTLLRNGQEIQQQVTLGEWPG